MTPSLIRAGRVFRVGVDGEPIDDPPRLLDLYAFLHDFNLAYEVGRAVTDPNYAGFQANQLLVPRGDGLYARLRDEDRMHVESLSMASPLDLLTVVAALPAAVGAVWGLVQIVEKVSNYKLNREKLRAEVDKLKQETAAAQQPAAQPLPPVNDPEGGLFLYENAAMFEERLRDRGAIDVFWQLAERLRNGRIRVTAVRVEVVSVDVLHDGKNEPKRPR